MSEPQRKPSVAFWATVVIVVVCLPLLYVLALQEKGEKARFFNDKLMAGSISMTCVTVDA